MTNYIEAEGVDLKERGSMYRSMYNFSYDTETPEQKRRRLIDEIINGLDQDSLSPHEIQLLEQEYGIEWKEKIQLERIHREANDETHVFTDDEVRLLTKHYGRFWRRILG